MLAMLNKTVSLIFKHCALTFLFTYIGLPMPTFHILTVLFPSLFRM